MTIPEKLTCRVLLAEDSADDQQLLVAALTQDRPTVGVTVVATGTEFRRLYTQGKYDCALLDYHLPDYRADELLESMKAELGDTPVLVISHRTDQDVAVNSIRYGGTDFVGKERALVHHELWTRVEHAMATRKRKDVERRHAERRERYLAQLADTDTLTGLNNRRYLMGCMRAGRWRHGRRMSLGCVMFDLDYFKHINDTFGHHAGDRTLRTVAGAIRSKLRSDDLAIRWGGEEILVVRQSRDLVDLWDWAESVCREVEGLTIQCEASRLNVTISAGFAVCPETLFDDSVMHAADEALYLAKKLGRNQVCSAQMVQVNKLLDEVTAGTSAEATALRRVFLERITPHLGPTQIEHVGQHCEKVHAMATLIARNMNLDPAAVNRIGLAGLFHDIGKCTIPESLLAKKLKLTPSDSVIVRRHVPIGTWIGGRLGLDAQTQRLIELHHNRFDAMTLPLRDQGQNSDEEMCRLGISIIGVADAYVTMLSQRPYCEARSPANALDELRREEGRQFDPQVIRAFASGPMTVRQAA